MRFPAIFAILFLPTVAQADRAPGLHEALSDCIQAMTRDAPISFPQAAEVKGDAQSGFVAWYHDANGTPVYATRVGVDGDVTICSGPNPMGPFLDDYATHDKAAVVAQAGALGLVELSVPAAGDYYADCGADAPGMLLAVSADATQRVGFKFITSPNVGATCAKFAP